MRKFRVALPGFNADRARSNELSVSDELPNPKIKLGEDPSHTAILFLDIASGPVYANGSITTWYSFKHGYDYIPTVMGVYVGSSSSSDIGGLLPFPVGALGEIFIDADETNINLRFASYDVTSAIPLPEILMRIRYFVMAEFGHSDT